MKRLRPGEGALNGELLLADRSLPFKVIQALPHTLAVTLPDGMNLPKETPVDAVTLWIRDLPCPLGRAIYSPHPPFNCRSTDPPPLRGHGKLSFRDDIYDFRDLLHTGNTSGLRERIDQLHLLWRRKELIHRTFRQYATDLVYDLQVYRTPFDEIDRGLEGESETTIRHAHEAALAWAFPRFRTFFDSRLRELEQITAHYSRQEHELHGFYFRKLVWSFILASEFMRRTNLKPRGYAGDSVMMRLLYERDYRGPTIFSKMMHMHPVEEPAAQAVRNRRVFLANVLSEARAKHPVSAPLRVLSVACGPAREIRDVLESPEDAERYDFTLLDQDPDALAEAKEEVGHAEKRIGTMPQVRFVLQSVRTMLQHAPLRREGERFDLVYSMGLFDYLNEPVARSVLRELFALLAPGGQLVVGNFHPRNQSRIYMEYWADWVLIYREEEELLGLADGLSNATCAVETEPSGCQCFLRIERSR